LFLGMGGKNKIQTPSSTAPVQLPGSEEATPAAGGFLGAQSWLDGSTDTQRLQELSTAPGAQSVPHTWLDGLHSDGLHRKTGECHDETLQCEAVPMNSSVATCTPCIDRGSNLTMAGLERWQEMGADGHIRCIPCKKYCDGTHEQTKDHATRVWDYLATLDCEYEEPEEQWLAWVKSDDAGYEEGLYLKCLLCDKWVTDLSGTDSKGYNGQHSQRNDACTKQHKKRMYYLDDQVFVRQMLAERSKWHPSKIQVGTGASAKKRHAPPELPRGWFAEWSEEHEDYFFYSSSHAQWEVPTTAAMAS